MGLWAERAPIEAIATRVRGRRALLVLDTCEHVLEGCASLAAGILRTTDRVTILATSREPLFLDEEVAWAVPPLDPASAVRLFEARGQQVATAFRLDSGTTRDVAAICSKLDNLPLAIELAAANVRILTCGQILALLRDPLRLLQGTRRTAAARHQTLQATLDWSYRLLSPQEQAAFRRMSVFRAGFTLEAAEAVLTDDNIERAEVLGLLRSLVNKSLVVSGDAGGAVGRYHLLDAVAEFCRHQVASSGEGDALRDRHAAHYAALARDWPLFGTDAEAEWRSSTECDQDNLRAALRWLATTAPSRALRMAGRLGSFWDSGRHSEGRAILDELLACDGAETIDRAWGLSCLSYVAFFQGDIDAAALAATECLELSTDLEDTVLLVFVLGALRNVAHARGDLSRVRSWGERIIADGHPRLRAAGWIMLAKAAFRDEDIALARSLGERGLSEAKAAGNPRWEGNAALFLAELDLEERRVGEARRHLQTAIGLLRPFHDVRLLHRVVQLAARLEFERGQHRRALRLASVALVSGERLGVNLGYRPEVLRLVSRLRSSIGPGSELDEETGRSVSLDQALEDVMDAPARLRERAGEASV
jgi:predicted ATPase